MPPKASAEDAQFDRDLAALRDDIVKAHQQARTAKVRSALQAALANEDAIGAVNAIPWSEIDAGLASAIRAKIGRAHV
jgi:hypothetical protein